MGENPAKYRRIIPKDRAANAGHRDVRLHSRVTGVEIVVEVDMDLGLKFSMLLQSGGWFRHT
jgi:hypothetical protein